MADTVTVTQVRAQLAALCLQIAGINTAYAEAPFSLNATDMPTVVILPGAVSEGEYRGEDYHTEIREYRILLYVTPRGAGLPGEGERLLSPFFDLLHDFFLARPSLGGLNGVMKAEWGGDGGSAILTYNDTPYLGIDAKISVETISEIVYATLE